MVEYESGSKYYRIKAKSLWIAVGILVVVAVVLLTGLRFYKSRGSVRAEYGSLESTLKEVAECCLCGENPRSLMGYYHRFDGVGVIGLNEWYVMDFRLQEYDDEGNASSQLSGLSMTSGTTQGVSFRVESTPSRGMSHATFSSEQEFNDTVIRENLCQPCLDKVTDTLVTYQKSSKEGFVPFVLVDYKTLDIYSLQKEHTGYFIGDYWVSLEYGDDIKADVYYLPEK